jgi:hypothetical protein
MPEELETKEEDGKQFIFVKGEWRERKSPKPKQETPEGNIPLEIKLGNQIVKGKARVEFYPKSERYGYALKIDEGQTVYGGGNLFVRA